MVAQPMDEFYEASPIKRRRRTKAQMEAFYSALLEIVAPQRPMTIRQAFYQAEVKGLVEKEESGYDKVQRALMKLRKDGSMPHYLGCRSNPLDAEASHL
jgi:hypothetical protein